MLLRKTKGRAGDLRVSLGGVGLDEERKLQSWVQSWVKSYGGWGRGVFYHWRRDRITEKVYL